MIPSLDFYIDCLVSLLLWKLNKKFGRVIKLYKISPTETYFGRQFSMDSCVMYESTILGIYDKYIPRLKPDDWAIDIGAHIGTSSIHLLRLFPEIKVISIEPDPSTYRLLEKNIRLNNLESQIQTINAAVAKTNGEGKLFIDRGNSGGNSLLGSGSSISIKLLTLESIFSKYKLTECALLKLDCEGAENEILMSTPPALLKRIKTIIMETHAGYDQSKLRAFLQSQGFLVTIVPNAINHPIMGKFLTVPLMNATRTQKT